jgi:uncharacterized protein YcfJ
MRTLTALVLALGLAGCADYGPKELGGGLLGAGGGALAGAQFGHGTGRLATTAGGALLGGWLGSSAGRSLDRADATYARGYSPYGYGY